MDESRYVRREFILSRRQSRQIVNTRRVSPSENVSANIADRNVGAYNNSARRIIDGSGDGRPFPLTEQRGRKQQHYR